MQNDNHIELLQLDAALLTLEDISQGKIESHIDNMIKEGFWLDEFPSVLDADPFQFKSKFEKLLSHINLTLPDKEKAVWIVLKFYLKRIANGLEDPLAAFKKIMLSVSGELYGKWEMYGVLSLFQHYDYDLDEVQSDPSIGYKNKFGNEAIEELKKDMITEAKIWLEKYGTNLKPITNFENELTSEEIEAIKKLIVYCNGSAETTYKTELERDQFINLTRSLSDRLHKTDLGLATTNLITQYELKSLLKVIDISEKFINQGIKENKFSCEYKREWLNLITFITRDYKRWLNSSKSKIAPYKFNAKERKIKLWSTILIGLLGYFATFFYYNFFTPSTIGWPIDSIIISIISIVPFIYSLLIGNILSKLLLKHIRNGHKNYGRIFWYGNLSFISITCFTILTLWLLGIIATLKTPLFSFSTSIITLTSEISKLPYSPAVWIGWGLSGLLSIGIYKLYQKLFYKK